MIRILCYGDSNTWGLVPLHGTRYPADTRWTGKLQQLLGEPCGEAHCEPCGEAHGEQHGEQHGKQYLVIEEGLSGRNTTLDDPNDRGRNGIVYFKPCLQSHQPLDLVILALGVNDLKTRFGRTAEDIAESIGELLQLVENSTYAGQQRKIEMMVLAPPPLDKTIAEVEGSDFGAESVEVSGALAKAASNIAQQHGAKFLDLGSLGSLVGADHLHYTAEAHGRIAEAVAAMVRSITA